MDSKWSDYLGGLTISHLSNGNTSITGGVQDQLALYGLLDTLADLNLGLVSVTTGPAVSIHQEGGDKS